MPTPGKEENECEETSSKRIKLDKDNSQGANLSLILEREIRNEINIRRNDLEITEQRIYQTRQSLVKIRQGIVAEYYKLNSKGILQMPPHPAVKDTFQGKRPAKRSNACVEDENEKGETPSKVSANDIVKTNDKVDSAINNGCETKDLTVDEQLKKLPRYIPPKYRDKDVVQLFEPRGNVKKQKFRLTIVNVSKWIFNKEDGGATHKWTIYVKNSDPSVDISLFVSKVTFFLHHSYKPNDVITVEYPPFKLTRRGWGEFPLRIQLHFINSLDKPVDVIHQLKLDTVHSGLDTFGNETVVDVWAHVNENERNLEDRIETVTENNEIKSEEETLLSTKIEQESSSSVKSSTYISDEYLSTSSLSQLSLQSLTTDISTDFLSDLFKESEPKQKEQIEMLKAEIENDCSNRQTEPIKTENVNDYSGFIESIKSELVFDGISGQQQTSSIITSSSEPMLTDSTEYITSELNFDKMSSEQSRSNEQSQSDSNQISASTASEEFPLEFLNSIEVLTKPEEIPTSNIELTTNFIDHEMASTPDVINHDITSSTADTYNPIECLNFVNDEVIIESEHEEDNTAAKIINKDSPTDSSLTCKNYLENFVDTEILSSNEETLKNDSIISNPNYIFEIPKIVDTSQQVRIAPLIPQVQQSKTIHDFSNSTLKLSPGNQIPIIETLQKAQNSQCLDNSNIPICINVYNNLNEIKSKPIAANKVFIEDINKTKKIKISSLKNNNFNPVIQKLNRKSSRNGNLVQNKNEAIIVVNNNEVKDVLNKSSRLTLAASNHLTAPSLPLINSQVTIADLNRTGYSDNLKQKLFIEMPDGKLREICSVKQANESSKINSKPIIIEPSIAQNRRNTPIEIPIKPKEVKKMVLINNSGIKIMPSAINQTKFKLNGQINQIQNSKRLILPIKTVQNSKQSILRPSIIASGSSQSPVLKSTTNQTNNAQFIKLVTKGNLITENIVVQRRVLPGESLLKKGNQVQVQETVTVAQGLQQVQGNAIAQRSAAVSTLTAALSDKILIGRCPNESIEFAVSWLIKQLPLVNEKAVNELYKTHHPYCAIDRITFLEWPLAKQRASEWMRAKKLGKLLLKVCPNLKQWSTFQIIDWARLRGYTPLGVPLRCKYVNNINIDSSFQFTPPDLNSVLKKTEKFNAEKINIDVEAELEIDSTAKSISSTEDRLYISIDNKYKQLGDFIFRSCDKFGHHFYEEEILPGVIYPAAERALISVFYSLSEDLFRRSLNASCMRNGVMPAMEVSLEDVKVAILSRKEFDIFTNEGLG